MFATKGIGQVMTIIRPWLGPPMVSSFGLGPVGAPTPSGLPFHSDE